MGENLSDKMTTYLLKHGKPVTDVIFNKEGDLLFSCDKEGGVFVWWSDNGERIGTYNGHEGAIYSLDVDRQTKYLITGSADANAKIWDVETGRCLMTYHNDVVVRCVKFNHGDDKFLVITDNVMKENAIIQVCSIFDERGEIRKKKKVVFQIEETEKIKVYKGIWGFNNERILTCNSEGSIKIYDTEKQKLIRAQKVHDGPITSLKSDKDCITYITASKDGKAKLFDIRSYECIKTYNVGRPINCSDISPLMEHIIMGGGERAEDVTTSISTTEQFQVRFYHSIYEEELEKVLGHFGPVNSISFNPDGRSFASGGEDGYVRLRHFPESYFENLEDQRIYR